MRKNSMLKRRGISFQERSVTIELHSAKATEEQCLPSENTFNAHVADYYRRLISLVDIAKQEAVLLESSSRDLRRLESAIEKHDSQIGGVVAWVGCEPSNSVVERLYDRHQEYVAEVAVQATSAVDNLFASYASAIDKLEERAAAIESLRNTFETVESLPVDIERQFERARQDFSAQEMECATYFLVKIAIKGRTWDPRPLSDHIAQAQADASNAAKITDLDRLRFEYAERGIACPLPRSFSQGKHSTYFSNSMLNNGDYAWAALPDAVLQILDRLHDVMTVSGFRVQLNSLYRNPKHNQQIGGNKNSQHQYGRAFDLQTFDFDESGNVTEDDWDLLKGIVEKESPTGIEPIDDGNGGGSGVGHVHAQWTNILF